MKKLIFSIIYALNILSIHAMQVEPLDGDSKENNSLSQIESRMIILISSDDKIFPVQVDLLSDYEELQAAALDEDAMFSGQAVNCKLDIPSSFLKILISWSEFVNNNKIDGYLKDRCEKVQHVLVNVSVDNLVQFLKYTLYLGSKILSNAIAYKLAQIIKTNPNAKKDIVESTIFDNLTFIAKHYSLRYNGEILDLGKITEQINSRTNISINDLLDYGVDIQFKQKKRLEHMSDALGRLGWDHVNYYRKYYPMERWGTDPFIRINLSKRNITSLQGLERIQNIQNVSGINLSHNQIKDLEENLNGLQHLEILDLSNNKIKEIHAYNFKNLPELNYLNLSNNGMESINDSFEILKVQVPKKSIGEIINSTSCSMRLPSNHYNLEGNNLDDESRKLLEDLGILLSEDEIKIINDSEPVLIFTPKAKKKSAWKKYLCCCCDINS